MAPCLFFFNYFLIFNLKSGLAALTPLAAPPPPCRSPAVPSSCPVQVTGAPREPPKGARAPSGAPREGAGDGAGLAALPLLMVNAGRQLGRRGELSALPSAPGTRCTGPAVCFHPRGTHLPAGSTALELWLCSGRGHEGRPTGMLPRGLKVAGEDQNRFFFPPPSFPARCCCVFGHFSGG